jgi:hypothetical protein
MMVTTAVALLLPLLGSVAALLMVALLLITLPFGALGSTLATTVMVAECAVFHTFNGAGLTPIEKGNRRRR